MTSFLPSMEELPEGFEVFLLDQWGVLHQGSALYEGVEERLRGLKASGKTVVIVSNSSKRVEENIEMMAALGLGKELYDGIVTSGEVAWEELKKKSLEGLGERCYVVSSSEEGSYELLRRAGITVSCKVEEATFLLVDGGVQEEKAMEDLGKALRGSLVLLCTNPDKRSVGKFWLGMMSPGDITDWYEERGGVVKRIGKPYSLIYDYALERGACIGDKDKIVAVGDSLENDIQGGNKRGYGTVFVARGIYERNFSYARSPSEYLSILEEIVCEEQYRPDFIVPSFGMRG